MDQQNKYAPGPWKADRTVIRDANGRSIASGGNNRVIQGDELASSLRVAAAAPDLLAALQVVMPALEVMRKQWPRSKHDDSLDVVAFARAAIAKAEGV